MDLGQQDFDRILFFEHARKNAEVAYAKNPLDVENLSGWAGALIELSQFQNRADSIKFVKDAISKLEEASEINPRKHDVFCSLGNAHTALAFYVEDLEDAKPIFAKAMRYFQQALEEDPGNQLYVKSMELASKAPELHAEFRGQMANQQAAGGGSSASTTKVSKKMKNSELKYDILGWVILAIGIVAWVSMAKSHVPPPPPRRRRVSERKGCPRVLQRSGAHSRESCRVPSRFVQLLASEIHGSFASLDHRQVVCCLCDCGGVSVRRRLSCTEEI